MHSRRKKNSVRVVFSFFCCFLLLVGSAGGAESPGARESMQRAVEEIMAILQNEELKTPEKMNVRRSLILTVVRHHFDFAEMSQLTLGAEWKQINESEQERFVDSFSRLIENSYIDKIEAYSGEEIIFQKDRARGDKSIVPTVIKRNNLEIPIQYKLVRKDGQWLVYDVVIEGVSLVQNYRSQFKNIIRNEQYAGLMKRLGEKVDKLAANTN
ncbi:MAG: hypothetical protein BM485_03210 [Desulfobulbaceae bacterium DB1]|nr:MAG: hypothetical protein BM485_03210 [Desulfobulbaceae bacterium DB1]